MTNQIAHDQSDLLSENMLNIGDFYHHLNLNNSNHSSRLNSKSSSNESTSECLFNSISSPSKSSTNEISSPESLKASQITASFRQRNLIAPNFNNESCKPIENDESQVTKLFVGNLPTSTTLPELLAVFKKYGPVNEKLSVVKDQNYAFIHFYNRKDAQVALQEVNDSLFKDRYIRVQFSTSQGYTFNNKHKFTDKKRISFNSNTDANRSQSNQTMSQSASSSSIFNQQATNYRNYRPITGKSNNQIPQQGLNITTQSNQKFNDFQQTQNHLMLLYLAQLQQQQQQQQQQKFTRSTTIDNFNLHSLSNDISMASPSSSSSSSQAFLMPNNLLNTFQTLSQDTNQSAGQNGMMRSNTMFSFPNNFTFNR